MKISFKPPKLMNNLVIEKYLESGNSLRRVIEIPTQPAKVLDIIYTKTDFLPTEWYVSNYNVRRRDPNSTIEKSLTSVKTFPNEKHTVVQRINTSNGSFEQVTIDKSNDAISKKVSKIKKITRSDF